MFFCRTLLWPIGDGATKSLIIGPPSGAGTPDDAIGTEIAPRLWTLRLGFAQQTYPPELFTALLRPANRQLEVGPIDLPLVFGAIDAPLELLITPAEPVTETVVVVCDLALYPSVTVAGATRTVDSPENVAIPLPPWVTWAMVQATGAVGVWRDAGASALVTFESGVVVPRPRNAVTVESSVDGVITLGYQ